MAASRTALKSNVSRFVASTATREATALEIALRNVSIVMLAATVGM